MKIWTYKEMYQKVIEDLDLEDETFIKPTEMIGYFNEALTEAESEIIVTNQDYLLTKFFVPTVQGQNLYDLPFNIFANKIRGVVYRNNSIIYQLNRFRRKDIFADIAFTDQYGASDDYRYLLVNDVPGQAKMQIHPASRETAVLAPYNQRFTPVTLWYIRNCARVPRPQELCNPELISTVQVDPSTDSIQTYSGTKTIGVVQQGLPGAYPGSRPYVTGDVIQLLPGYGGELPTPLKESTDYYVIATPGGVIKLAASRIDAINGVAIDITDAGTVYFILQVRATESIIQSTLIDIPEFSTFIVQWVKCRCMEKEGDPRLAGAVDTLAQQKAQMVSTLTDAIVDNDTLIEGDFTLYFDMN